MDDFGELKKIIDEMGFDDFLGYEKFEKYMEGILEWNTKVNLTNITDEAEFVKKHFADSVLIAKDEEFKKAKTVVDIGTGGGFPGVPLAILFPEKEFVLLDSLNKRLKIIDELTESIGIKNVRTIHGRAEELAHKKEMREAFDICVSRAVANLTTLAELCLPFVKKEGMFVAYKGPGVYEELEAAEKAIEVLGGKVEKMEEANFEEGRNHKLLYIRKIKNTNKKYPRKPGEPAKNPIK